MWTIISSLLGGLGSSIIAPILGYFTSKDAQTLAGFTAAAGVDATIATAQLNAQVEIAQLKASTNTWWGARLVWLLVVGTAGLHFAAIMLDSTFHFGWAIPKAPAPYDGYEWAVLQSLVIIAPAAPVLSAVTAWLHRK
jgi:hypothetical protein